MDGVFIWENVDCIDIKVHWKNFEKDLEEGNSMNLKEVVLYIFYEKMIYRNFLGDDKLKENFHEDVLVIFWKDEVVNKVSFVFLL